MATKKKTTAKKAAASAEPVEPTVRHAAVQETTPDGDVYYVDEATRRKAHGK